MEQTSIKTTLLPPEIATARKVRAKKPWAVLAVAVLLLATTISAFGYADRIKTVSESRFGDVEEAVSIFEKKVNKEKGTFNKYKGEYEQAAQEQKNLLAPLENRNKWMEILKTINECLPRDTGIQLDNTELSKKEMVKMTAITAERVLDVGEWFNELLDKEKIYMLKDERKTDAPAPKGPGYIVTLDGYHFHEEEDITRSKVLFINNTVIKNFQRWTFLRPEPRSRQVDVRKLGISHTTIIASKVRPYQYYPNGKKETRAVAGGQFGGGPMGVVRPATGRTQVGIEDQDEKFLNLIKTSFKIQFIWQPIPIDDRKEFSPEEAALIEKKGK